MQSHFVMSFKKFLNDITFQITRRDYITAIRQEQFIHAMLSIASKSFTYTILISNKIF